MGSLTDGGTDGNERLTAATSVVLLALLAVLGPTIVLIGQLISVHLFVGLLLIGPVLMKLASTGYRFVRYYAGNAAYRLKGPPPLALRATAPLLVASTMVVFVSGCLLLIDGPGSKGSWLELHKVSFIVWLVVAALHVLGHVTELPASLGIGEERGTPLPGRRGRRIALIAPFVAGIVLAVALIPQYAPWTASGALKGHHHHDG
jgi:hypothetical protein